jgi:hypothetical protein
MVDDPVVPLQGGPYVYRVTLVTGFTPGDKACVRIITQREDLPGHARNIFCRVESMRVSVSAS